MDKKTPLDEVQSGHKFDESFKLQADFDELDENHLSEMSIEEVEEVHVRVLKGNSKEARELRDSRKKIRYKLYRLRTQKEGKSSAADVVTEEFVKYFESQPLFKGWKFFAELWDVSLVDPMRVVARHHGEKQEWEEVMAAKLPQIGIGGKITYPDITVRDKVMAEAKLRE